MMKRPTALTDALLSRAPWVVAATLFASCAAPAPSVRHTSTAGASSSSAARVASQASAQPAAARAPAKTGRSAPAKARKPDALAEALAIVGSPRALAERSEEARARLEAIAQKDPSNVLVWYNIGLIAWHRGDVSGAEAAWRQALSKKRNYLPARARLAQIRLLNGERDAAVAELERIIDKEAGGDPYQPEARNVLAGLAIQEKRWEEARRHARNVLLGDADNMNAYLNLALTYFRRRLVDTALLIVDTALKRRPDAAALHNLMGLIYLRKDNSRLAMTSFARALDANPNLVDAKLNLAALELSYGDFEAALGRFDSVLESRPNATEIVMSRAVALRGLERYAEAAAGYKQTLTLDPDYSQAQYNLCVLHHQYTNDWQAALEACAAYAATLPRLGKKRRELNRRLRSIKATIEALAEDEEAAGGGDGDDGAQAPEEGGATPEPDPDPSRLPATEGSTP
jgi:tetratricopeptide (TPR) repeat protein